MKISGKVTNSRTGEAIPYANVYFAKNREGVIGPQNYGTSTNEFGTYRLDWPADTWITASAVGFKKTTKPLPYEYTKDHVLNFSLDPEISELSGAEIVAKPINKTKTTIITAAVILAVLSVFFFISKKRFA